MDALSNYGLRAELRNLIFNSEMALCDLRGFASGGSEHVDANKARERAAELRAEAEKIESLFGVRRGQDQKPLSR